MRRTAFVAVAVLTALTLHAPRAFAQGRGTQTVVVAIDSAVLSAITRARRMVDAGEGDQGRALLDSLVTSQGSGSDELAEALYWRAVLREQASEAERDWKRLVVESPLSPRAPEALLWLAELELVRGHPAIARGHLERLLREHPGAPQRPRAALAMARSHFDEQDPARACALVSSPELASLPEGELRLQAGELRNRCAAIASRAAERAADSARASVGDTTVPTPAREAGERAAASAARGRWSVQLAAFPTRAEADRAVRRLASRGITARVDGTKKPYRVRTGRYATRAEATAALAKLKKQGHTGFVTEVPR